MTARPCQVESVPFVNFLPFLNTKTDFVTTSILFCTTRVCPHKEINQLQEERILSLSVDPFDNCGKAFKRKQLDLRRNPFLSRKKIKHQACLCLHQLVYKLSGKRKLHDVFALVLDFIFSNQFYELSDQKYMNSRGINLEDEFINGNRPILFKTYLSYLRSVAQ